jgi:hypothetical protein
VDSFSEWREARPSNIVEVVNEHEDHGMGDQIKPEHHVTGFGADFSKLKSVQWVTNAVRRCLKLTQNALISFYSRLRPSTLNPSPRRLFECGICMEEMPDDSIARPDPCGHAFCRECLRGHVTARLDEHRFPILCPTCTAGKGKGKGATSGTCCERTGSICLPSHVMSA